MILNLADPKLLGLRFLLQQAKGMQPPLSFLRNLENISEAMTINLKSIDHCVWGNEVLAMSKGRMRICQHGFLQGLSVLARQDLSHLHCPQCAAKPAIKSEYMQTSRASNKKCALFEALLDSMHPSRLARLSCDDVSSP